MELRVLLLLLKAHSLILLVLCISASGQNGLNCAELELSDLGDTTDLSSTGLLADTLISNSGESGIMIRVIQPNIVCLSQGDFRDTYRTVSVIVEYCSATENMTIIVQVEYQCTGGVWGFGSQPSLISNPTGTLTTAQRTDCFLGIDPAMAPVTVTLTQDEHCAGNSYIACMHGYIHG